MQSKGRGKNRDRGKRRARLMALALLGLVPALALGLGGGGASAEAVEGGRPNVLLIISDDQRDGTMGVMDATRRIFARGGTRFANAHVTSPLCCPSRATIFSGLYNHNNGVTGNVYARRFDFRRSLPRELKRRGYYNAILGKFLNRWEPDEPVPYFDHAALDYGNVRRGQDRFSESDFVLADRVDEFLAEREGEDARPWFLVLSPHTPHPPLAPAERYRDADVPLGRRAGRSPGQRERDLSDKPAWVRREARRNRGPLRRTPPRIWRRETLRMQLSLDDLVERTFAALEARGERDTLAIYLSDNGFMWGEHGLLRKAKPYLESIEIPLFLRWPGRVAAGAVDRRLVANVDVTPTIYDALGIEPSYSVDGRSLLSGRSRRWLLTEFGHLDRPGRGFAAYVGRRFHYIETYEQGLNDRRADARELYDLRRDPHELRNRHPRLAGSRLLRRIKRRLHRLRFCRAEACP